MRLIYSLLLYLLTPIIWLRLLWRSRKQPEYLQHLGERFGFYSARPKEATLWIHAVSVGETRAAQPLIEGMLAQWPQHRILLTGMTPTGRETGQTLYGNRVDQAYLPYDYPGAVNRFFRHFSPEFGVIMETEIWPNLLAGAAQDQIPVLLANARLSARSARGYQRFSPLVRPAFSSLQAIAAQTEEDAQRLRESGAVNVSVCGNLKFDVTASPAMEAQGKAWRSALGDRSIWLAASTREGEEAEILAAWKDNGQENTLLVLVPRHPQRFEEVAKLIEQAGFRYQRRSTGMPDKATQIWLGDSMGEMVAYYHLAQIAFIGGSLRPLGGQNLIEAAACACPVLIGPHTFNFKQATEDALAAGAARRIQDASELVAEVSRLLKDSVSRENMVTAAQNFAASHRGATQRTLALIARSTDPAGH